MFEFHNSRQLAVSFSRFWPPFSSKYFHPCHEDATKLHQLRSAISNIRTPICCSRLTFWGRIYSLQWLGIITEEITKWWLLCKVRCISRDCKTKFVLIKEKENLNTWHLRHDISYSLFHVMYIYYLVFSENIRLI